MIDSIASQTKFKMKEQLPAFVLSELFSNSLVYTGEKIINDRPKANIISSAKKEGLSTKRNYLGNYQKEVIVLVNDENNTYLSDDALEFLTGILGACKLNLADIALINFNKTPVDFTQLKKEMKPGYLLLFGINAVQVQLPFAMPDYQVQQYDNCRIVSAPGLQLLNQSTPEIKAEKTKLWKSLQKMFSIEK
jgi:hypothetical protein